MNDNLLGICLLLIFCQFSSQQSAELEDLQQLCPNLKGIFCTHCDHKSVEEICPIECKFCSSTDQPRIGFSRNLADLQRQCSKISASFCYTCKIPAISELCVEECLACAGGIVPPSTADIGFGEFNDELSSVPRDLNLFLRGVAGPQNAVLLDAFRRNRFGSELPIYTNNEDGGGGGEVLENDDGDEEDGLVQLPSGLIVQAPLEGQETEQQ